MNKRFSSQAYSGTPESRNQQLVPISSVPRDGTYGDTLSEEFPTSQLSPSSRAISYLHKLSQEGQSSITNAARAQGTACDTDTTHSNIVDGNFLELPESLLPHLNKIDRRFKRGQIFGYFLIITIFLGLAAISLIILIFSQRRTTTYNVELTAASQADFVACSNSPGSCPAVTQVRYQRHQFEFVQSISLWVVFLLAALIMTVLKGLNDLRRRKLIESLPGESIDLWQLTVPKNSTDKRRSKQCFSRSMLLSIRDEFQRVIVLQKLCKELPKRFLEAPGDNKWGRSENGMCFHYQTSIAVSYKSLEQAAITYNSSLSMGPKESVRQYIERIKRSCPGIDLDICDEYVQYYERAKFGDSNGFNKEEYDKFIAEIFYYLLKYLCSSADKDDEGKSLNESG